MYVRSISSGSKLEVGLVEVCFEGGECVEAVQWSCFAYIIPQIYNSNKVGTSECASLTNL